jgi:hypothetical protein
VLVSGRAVVGVVVLALAGTLTGSSRAAPSIVVLDRTFSCEAGYLGGLYQVQLSSTYQPASPSRLQAVASITRNMWDSPYGMLASSGFSVHRGLCAPSTAKVKLTTKGLRGGAVPSLGVEAMCETPRRVLMRVRAVFSRPPDVATSRQFGFPQLNAFGAVTQAAIAVGTPAGKTFGYVSVSGSEKARLFTVRTCKED